MKEQSDAGCEAAPETFDDRELVAACLRGDHAAWEALILRYQRLVYSVPIKLGFSPVDAADIFQSVCLKLFEQLAALRDHERVSAWLVTTTTRECWRVAERHRRESQASVYDEEHTREIFDRLAAADPPADQQHIAFERQQAVREAIQQLPERCRDLISMLFYQKDELSYAEIARRMRLPQNSLGPTRARCLKKLKKILEGKI